MKKMLSIICTVILLYGCSSNSNNGIVTVAPLAPTRLTGTVISNNQVNLSWTDNATNEDGYKIERKTSGGNFTVVGSAGANISNFSDLGLTGNTTYTYRVYSYNSAGSSLQYSNEVNVTTQDSIPTWLSSGLVGYWPFNGNANDESGNGNNGTVNGATFTTDRFGNSGKAYGFDGMNCETRIDAQVNTNSISLNNSYTVSFWVNKNGDGCMEHPRIMEFYSLDNVGALQFSLDVTGLNELLIEVGNNNSQINGIRYFNSNWLYQWYHLIVTCNSNYFIFYVNGIEVNRFNFSGLPRLAQNVSFGRMNHPAFNTFNGKIDDIRIYNRALAASEVAYLASH